MADDKKPWERDWSKGDMPWTRDWSAAPTPAVLTATPQPRFPSLGPTTYQAANFLRNLMPTAGAAIGAAGGAPTGVGIGAGAFLGGLLGTESQNMLERALYKNVPPETAGQYLSRLGFAGAKGTLQELPIYGINKIVGAGMAPFTKSAETIEAAEQGKGIRFLPGEQRPGMMRRGISLMEHWPGSGGTLEKFREVQQGDVDRYIADQLGKISSQQLSKEEIGTAVQNTVQGLKKQSEAIIDQKFGDVKQMLGISPGKYVTPEEFDALIAKAEKSSGLVDAKGRPIPGMRQTVTRARLQEARTFFRQQDELFSQRLMQRILNTDDPQIIGAYFQKTGTANLARLRSFMTPAMQQAAARNVVEDWLIPAERGIKTGEYDPLKASSLLTKGLKRLGEARGRAILGNQYDAIVEAASYLNQIGKTSGSGIQGAMHMAGIVGTLGGIVVGAPVIRFMGHPQAAVGEAISAGALGYVGPKILALALTNPGKTAAVLNFLRLAAAASIRIGSAGVDEFLSESPAQYQPLPRMEAPEP